MEVKHFSKSKWRQWYLHLYRPLMTPVGVKEISMIFLFKIHSRSEIFARFSALWVEKFSKTYKRHKLKLFFFYCTWKVICTTLRHHSREREFLWSRIFGINFIFLMLQRDRFFLQPSTNKPTVISPNSFALKCAIRFSFFPKRIQNINFINPKRQLWIKFPSGLLLFLFLYQNPTLRVSQFLRLEI